MLSFIYEFTVGSLCCSLCAICILQWLPLGLFALLLLKYIALDATPSVRASSEGRSSMRRGSSLFDLWHPSAASLRASEVHESAAQVDCVDGAAQSIKHVPECCADEQASAVEEVIPVEPTPAEELPASGTRPLFTIGTPRSSSSDPEEDEVLTAASPEAKEPRSLEECLRIKTEVRKCLSGFPTMCFESRHQPAKGRDYFSVWISRGIFSLSCGNEKCLSIAIFFKNGLVWRAKDKFIEKKKDQGTTSYAIISTSTTRTDRQY